MSAFDLDTWSDRAEHLASSAGDDATTVLEYFCRYGVACDEFAYMEPLPPCERIRGGAL